MATTTPNFGWAVPTSTDLVKDGAVAIETLGDSIDASLLDLKGGTTGQVLAKATNTDMDFTWTTPTDQTPLTTKGDLFTFSTVDARLGVGTNGQTLVADSTASTGLKWATPSGSSGPAFSVFRNTTSQSFTTGVDTKVQFNGETFDTDNCFDSTTNYRFTPTTAGYYQINGSIYFDNGSANYTSIFLRKNGSNYKMFSSGTIGASGAAAGGNDVVYMNGSSDYLELWVYSDATSPKVYFGSSSSYFSGVWVRS